MSVKIILADDHRLFREGIRTLFEQQQQLRVVAVAEDGRSTIQLVRKYSPDIVIMDISMPGLNGIDATRQLHLDRPDVKVIALSMHSDRHFVLGIIRAGAAGYLLKDCAFDELVQAVHTVAGGNSYLSPDISGVVLEEFRHLSSETSPSDINLLSQREREVLQLFAEGESTRQVAEILCLSIKTIETHRANLMKKLDIHSLAKLTKYAIREGLTHL